jgi:hypothetical protein
MTQSHDVVTHPGDIFRPKNIYIATVNAIETGILGNSISATKVFTNEDDVEAFFAPYKNKQSYILETTTKETKLALVCEETGRFVIAEYVRSLINN